MVMNPPAGTQRIAPYLYYEDYAAALDFLEESFGFEMRFAMRSPSGAVMHAETGYEDNVVMLGTPMDEAGRPVPVKGLARHAAVHCYVDDVDSHYAKARAAGATIESDLEDRFYGDRSYTAVDPEGHHWHFATHVRDVAPEDMKPPGT